jgi:hypothetical protein
MHKRLIVLCRPRIVLCKSLLTTALLALCAAPAQSDTLQTPQPRMDEAVRILLVTTTPPARSFYRPDAYRCGDYAVFAGSTLSTVRYWTQHGASPQQAVEMTSRGGADADLAERAAQAPDTITPDDFRRQTLVECLNAAAERR